MAGGELFLLHQLQEVLREGQQPQGIGDGRPGFSHPIRHLFLCEAVFLHQHLIAPGLFGRVQVLSLEVLDQAQLHHFAVIRLNDDCRHLRQAGQLGGPPASLTGDDLVVAGGQTAHCQRLDDTVDPDRLCQIGQGILVKALPGLIQAGLYLGNGEGDGALSLRLQVRVAQQGVQPPAQAQLFGSLCHSSSFLIKITVEIKIQPSGPGLRPRRKSGGELRQGPPWGAWLRSPPPAAGRPPPPGSRGRRR